MEGPWSGACLSLRAYFYFLKICSPPVEGEGRGWLWSKVWSMNSCVGWGTKGKLENFWQRTCIPSEGGLGRESQEGWKLLAKPWERLGKTGKSSSTRNASKNIELENDTKWLCHVGGECPLQGTASFAYAQTRILCCHGFFSTYFDLGCVRLDGKTRKWRRWTMHTFPGKHRYFPTICKWLAFSNFRLLCIDLTVCNNCD